MGKPCAFCLIAGRSAPARVVYEDELAMAFLDARPLFPGHTLLIPRRHIETLGDLPPAEIGPIFAIAQRLSLAIPAAVGAQGTFVAINNRVSQSVPHLHIHIVPRTRGDGLRGFFWPRHPYKSEAEMDQVAGAIREALTRVTG